SVLENSLEVFHVVMAKLNRVADCETGSFENRCVIFTIRINDIVTADQARKGSLVGKKARAVNQTSLFFEKSCELDFELFVRAKIAVQKARARTTRSVLIDCSL